MKLKDVMTPKVETISADTTLQQAARAMVTFDVGFLPIVQDKEVVGVITDRDIAVRSAARGLDPKHTEVRAAMTEAPICAFETQDVEEGAHLMMTNQIRRLPILDQEKHLVGIVSLGDLSRAVPDVDLVAQTLERISEESVPETRARV